MIVDGRGTGYKGRKLRNPVRGNLGFYETLDQVNAARRVLGSRPVGWYRDGISSSSTFLTGSGQRSDTSIRDE